MIGFETNRQDENSGYAPVAMTSEFETGAQSPATDEFAWTVILPTYRRADVLEQCLRALAEALPQDDSFEVLVYDNGLPESSRSVGEPFADRLNLRYAENEPGHGLGYSLSRGAGEAKGTLIVELNDDAIVPNDFFDRLGEVFDSDPAIGVVGVRAIEDGYQSKGAEIGVIDSANGRVVGNFDRPTDGLLDVEHVYGFCYGYRRELLKKGGHHDNVLLAKDYSSGNRIETDHCLTAKRLGFRVVYDGRIAVQHLAKPRGDINERSMKWKLNQTRNTLYLFLKHFGLFGRGGVALRFALLHDLGIRSALLQPSSSNWAYLWTGLRARASAFAHWIRYQFSR